MLVKFSIAALSLIMAVTAVAASVDNELLFQADFDQYSANASIGKGGTQCTSFANPDLQLRMFPGVGNQGNAINLNNRENCTYPAAGNFNSACGTVTLWLAPQNWKPSEKKVQVFFDAVIAKGKFRLLIYKNQYANCFYALIIFPDAPGTAKNFQATSFLPDSDWPAGKWHRLDVTWDSEQLKLYVDGLQTPRHRWHISTRKFPQKMNFPSPVAGDTVTIGTSAGWQKNAAVDPAHRTAFDLVQIRNRPLSAAEIKADYEKTVPSVFGKVRQIYRINIPAVKKYGELSSRLPIANVMTGSEVKQAAVQDAAAELSYDPEKIYLDFACRYLPRPARITKRDGNLWEDDSVEVHLRSKNSTFYHFIINSCGVVYDARNGNPAWNSDIECRAAVKDGKWQMHLAIPRKDLDAFAPGDLWKGNIFVSTMNKRGAYCFQSWFDGGLTKMFAHPSNAAELQFGNAEEFKLTVSPDMERGKFELSLTRNGNVPLQTEAFIFAENGEKITFTGDLNKSRWQTPLNAGKYQLLVKLTRQQNTIFLYEKFFTVHQPLELKYTAYPSRKFIEVTVDFSNAGGDILRQLKQRGIPGEVTLSKDGKIHASTAVVAAGVKNTVKLPLPPDLPAGTWQISGIFAGLENKTAFRIPDMTPYRLRLASGHDVPPPWVPIREKSELHFTLLDREYIFGASPAPVQILSRGEKMLSALPVWKLNGVPVQWEKAAVTAKYDDMVILSGKGCAGKVNFNWQGELHFDGVYKLTLQMLPAAGKAIIDSWSMEYQTPAGCARYVLSPTLLPWQNDRIAARYEILQPNSNRDFFIWTTGIEKGLMWWPKSNANFVNRKGEKQINLSRNREQASVRVDFISRQVELTRPAEYVSVFLATPVKPLPANSRVENISGWGRTAHSTMQPMGWNVFGPNEGAEDCTSAAGLLPAHPDKFQQALDRWKKVNVKPFLYGMPAQIATNDSEFDYFYAEWAKTPTYAHAITKKGVRIINESMCGHTQIADLGAFRADRLFRAFPDLSGLYFDLSDVRFCENALHGCGGIDAFGQPYLSSIALNLREFMKRIYKISRQYNREILMHAHNLFNPIAHSFNDYWYPGEQTFAPLSRNIEHYYCEGISREELQSEYNSVIKGVPVVFLPQYGRVSNRNIGFPHLKARNKELTGPEYAIRTMTPMLVHDVNVAAEQIHWGTTGKLWTIRHDLDLGNAEFRGYWFDDAIISNSPDVLISWYILRGKTAYSHLLTVANFARDIRPAGVMINWQKSGIAPNAEFVELWSNRPLTRDELAAYPVKGNHFLLIGVKPGNQNHKTN